MQELLETNADTTHSLDKNLHSQAKQYIEEAYQLVFQRIPLIISRIIQNEAWKQGNVSFNNFGEYALDQSADGLGISNNNLLWLLKFSMDAEGEYIAEWGDVLNEVDTAVRTYAKENDIAMKELSGRLSFMNTHSDESEAITYLPSRSKSNDGQLLKLRKSDEQAYQEVVTGKRTLKEAFPSAPRKQLMPVESLKNKFNNLSSEDRTTFLHWIEKQLNNSASDG